MTGSVLSPTLRRSRKRTCLLILLTAVLAPPALALEWQNMWKEADLNLPPRMQHYNRPKSMPDLLPWETDEPESLNVRLVGKWDRGPAAEANQTDGDVFMIDTLIRPIPKKRSQVAPAAAFDGTNYLVVWQDHNDSTPDPNICCTRVSPSGRILDPAGGILVGSIPGFQRNPAVTYGGGCHLVVWDDSSGSDCDIRGARLTPTGLVLDSPGFVISGAQDNQKNPVVAFDGTNFLVLWNDHRGSSDDIYGARVSLSGEVLDTNGIAVSTAAGGQTLPSVAFGSNSYLAVWQDGRNGSADVYGARISPSGQLLDSSDLCISAANGNQEMPGAAFDGINFLVVWDDGRNPNDADIYATRVTPGGQILDSSGFAVSAATDDQLEPALVFDGAGYLAVWEDNRNPATAPQVYGARIATSGSVLDPDGIRISDSTIFRPQSAVTAGAGQFLALWQSMDAYGYWYIKASRVTPGGTPLDTTAIFVSTNADNQYCPAVAFDGTNYLVAWVDQISEVGRAAGPDHTIYGRRVSQSGTMLDTCGFRIAPLPYGLYDPFYPDIAFDGANYLVVWQKESVQAARVSPAGVVLDSPPISISAGPVDISTQPAVGFDGTNYLVTWDDWRGGSRGIIFAARVSPNGQVVDPGGFSLSASPSDQWYPAVAFDGSNYLVVWSDRRGSSGFDIYAARIAPSGLVLDSAGIPVSRAPDWQTEPAVAFDGTNFLAIWHDGRSSHPGVYCARIAPSGVVLDTGGIHVAPSLLGAGMSVVFDGQNYFAVWPRGGMVKGAVINPAGVVLDTVVVAPGLFPKVALGDQGQKLVVCCCFTDAAQGEFYRANRVWGRMSPFEALAEGNQRTQVQSSEVAVFPNPARSLFRVRTSETIRDLAIYDAGGRLIRREIPADRVWSREIRVATENMTPGIYFLELRTGAGRLRTKLVVE